MKLITIFLKLLGFIMKIIKHASEIAAFALQYELASEGFLSKYFPDLAEGLEEVLFESRRSSLFKRQSARSTSFLIPEHTPSSIPDFSHSMPVKNVAHSPLNPKLEAFKTTIKSVMQKGLSKAWQGTKDVLKVGGVVGGVALAAYGKAGFGIPLELIIELPNHDPSDPHAVEKALATASGTWSLNIVKFNLLNKLHPVLAIYVGVGEICAQFTPQGAFLERAQALPTDDQIDNMFEGQSLTDAKLYKEEIAEMRNRYIEWEYTYDFFRSITSSHVMQKISEKIGAYVDAKTPDGILRNYPSHTSKNSIPTLEEIEQIVQRRSSY